MPFSWLADLVVVFHLAFVAFVMCGGMLAFRWPRLAWLHVPALVWGIAIEYVGWICPLTPLEQRLRLSAGEAGYPGGFVDHYLLPLLYPPGLTRPTQWFLATLVLGVNAVTYLLLIRRRAGFKKRKREPKLPE